MALTPGQDLQLIVGVDESLTNASNVSLYYSINGSATTITTQAGNGSSTYQFTIPGAQLDEGDIVDYAFLLDGDFAANAACEHLTEAKSPPHFGFRSLATTDVSLDNEKLIDVMSEAESRLTHQPEYATSPPSQVTVCNRFFSTPSPCDIHQSDSPSSSPGQIQVGPVASFGGAAAGPGPRSCQLPLDAFWARIGDQEGEGAAYARSTIQRDADPLCPECGDDRIRLRAFSRAFADLGSHASISAWDEVGFAGGFTGGEPSYEMTMRLRYGFSGRSVAYAQNFSTYPLCDLAICSVLDITFGDNDATVLGPTIFRGSYRLSDFNGGPEEILEHGSFFPLFLGERASADTDGPAGLIVPFWGDDDAVTHGPRLDKLIRWKGTFYRDEAYAFFVALMTGSSADSQSGKAWGDSDFEADRHPSELFNKGVTVKDFEMILPEGHHWNSCPGSLQESP